MSVNVDCHVQEQEQSWEELAEYAAAYNKVAIHLSMPLGRDKMTAFVKELYPQEFFPDDIVKSLISCNSNILPFDFIGYVK